MIRLMLSLTLSAILLFTAALCLIRFHPRDEPLRALLYPETCQPPCFMNIYPGETTMTEAIQTISSHPWVGNVRRLNTDGGWIIIEWSGQQPPEYDFNRWATLHAVDGIVESITVPTHISMVDFWLTVGKPDWLFSSPIRGGTTYGIGNFTSGISAQFDTPAPNRLRTLLGSDVTLFYTRGMPPRIYPHPSLLDIVTGRAKSPYFDATANP